MQEVERVNKRLAQQLPKGRIELIGESITARLLAPGQASQGFYFFFFFF
jgi:hypothetical protein